MVKRTKKAPKKKSGKAAGPFRSDNRHVLLLKRVMREAVAEALNVNKALDIPITYLKGKEIIREYNDGRMETLGLLKDANDTSRSTHLKRGDVIDLTK